MANSFWTLFGALPVILAGRPRLRGVGTSAELEHLSDNQLADLGIRRDGAGRYRRLREPASLEALFPRSGEASGGGHSEMSPPTPQRGPTRRKTVG